MQRGFWYSHIGWIFDRTLPAPYDESNVQDLLRYPELRWVDRHEWVALVAYAFACFAIGGIPGLVWGFAVSSVAVLHATALINSLAHLWGSRRYDTADESRNNALLALLTLGEGWHNNHHFYMSSARQGFFWWEFDLTYYSLKVLSWLGVVWGLRQPPRLVLGAFKRSTSERGGRRTAARHAGAHASSHRLFAPGRLAVDTGTWNRSK